MDTATKARLAISMQKALSAYVLLRQMPPCPFCQSCHDAYGVMMALAGDNEQAILMVREIAGNRRFPALEDEALLCLRCCALLQFTDGRSISAKGIDGLRPSPEIINALVSLLLGCICRAAGPSYSSDALVAANQLTLKLDYHLFKHKGGIFLSTTGRAAWDVACLGCGQQIAAANNIHFQLPGPFTLRLRADRRESG